MKKQALLAALLGAATLATSAIAQPRHEGGYMGISIAAVSTEAPGTFAAGFNDLTADQNVTGYKLFGGYMWGSWGVEGGLYDLGKHDVNLAATGQKVIEFKAAAAALSAVYVGNIGQSMTVNLKAGVAHVSADFTCLQVCAPNNLTNTEKTSSTTLFGVGLGYRISDNVILRLDFERFSGVTFDIRGSENESPYELITAGVQFHF